jgi:hypothetical protein
MTLREAAGVLEAEILHGADEVLDVAITTAAASDLMSDILARLGSPDIMLTGLTTAQTIRTSSVAGIKAVCVCRGKTVPEALIELAQEEDIVLMGTRLTLFESSGRLYEKGLRGVATR